MNVSYETRRQELTRYFDRTAASAWTQLTSDAPVSRIRATVRAGRDEMRAQLLAWLPQDLRGRTLFDAGCGTGSLAVDVSPTLIEVARRRTPSELASRIDFAVGDMLDGGGGRFDYVVAMDSLIHYDRDDILRALSALGAIAEQRVVMTFAPRTAALSLMHAVGRMFPRGSHRAPAIEPVSERSLCDGIRDSEALADWSIGRTRRISVGFYVSQGLELERACDG
ncbi:MAG: magnesium protoporphyrin IX methyltransferase [Gammaproteobacteria bacterium]